MKCPRCGEPTFALPNSITTKDLPGHKESSQRRKCTNPACANYKGSFKVEAYMVAERPPEPPEAA